MGWGSRFGSRRSGVVGVMRVMGGLYRRTGKVRKMNRNRKRAEMRQRELR